jgi:hypothetical protein
VKGTNSGFKELIEIKLNAEWPSSITNTLTFGINQARIITALISSASVKRGMTVIIKFKKFDVLQLHKLPWSSNVVGWRTTIHFQKWLFCQLHCDSKTDKNTQQTGGAGD